MTSKACCSNICSDIYAVLKRQIWLVALWFAALFFALPVYTALMLQDLRYSTSANINAPAAYNYAQNFAARAAQSLTTVFGPGSPSLIWLLLLMAFISALVFFGYLHKQRQVDFYHSQPRRREALLLTNTAAGLLSVLLPYLANLLFSLLVALAMGAGAAIPWGQLFLGLAVHILYFTAIFATALIAVLLSGNGAVAALTGLFLLSVGPALLGLGLALINQFYPVFYTSLYDWGLVVRWLSPAAAYASIAINGLVNGIIPIIIYDALVLAAAVRLYRKRPGEASGQAIAFNIAKPLLKYSLALVAASALALLFQSLSSYRSGQHFWWYFGAVTGGFLATQITEIVYAFDFRAIIRHLRGLAVFLVLYLVVSTCAIYDITGFNTKVPPVAQVAKAEIYLNGIDNHLYETWVRYGYAYESAELAQERQALEYGERDTLSLGLAESPEAIAAAVNIANRFANRYQPGGGMQSDVSEAERAAWAADGRQYLLDYLDNENNGGYINLNYASCHVVFTLQNGRKIARDYSGQSIPVQFLLDDIRAIYADPAHQAAQLTGLNYADEHYLPETLTIFENYYGLPALPELTMEQRSRLLAALRADALEQNIEERLLEMPIGYLQLLLYAGPVGYEELKLGEADTPSRRPFLTQRWPIYASYRRTLAFWAGLGYGPELWQPQLAAINEIRLISPYTDRYEAEKYSYGGPAPVAYETYDITVGSIASLAETGQTTVVTDPEKIAEIMANSWPTEAAEFNTLIDVNRSLEAEVSYTGPDGLTYVTRRVFGY